MKLRIKGNSLRMRLSQHEVDKFVTTGNVSDVISFGETELTYRLQASDSEQVSIAYDNNLIQVNLPKQVGTQWATSDQVGVEEVIRFDQVNSLSILIEKDFKCLTVRLNEDESDLFENPLSKHDCE